MYPPVASARVKGSEQLRCTSKVIFRVLVAAEGEGRGMEGRVEVYGIGG